mgnify:CR=1 FL=1
MWVDMLGPTLTRMEHVGFLMLAIPGPTETTLHGHAVIGLYFSADWCQQCSVFTPVLEQLYSARRARGADQRVLAMRGREARLRASEAALRASEGVLERRERDVERREGALRGLAKAIRTVLDEVSAWLGEAIPASVREAVPALQRALEKLRPEQKRLDPEDEGPGM